MSLVSTSGEADRVRRIIEPSLDTLGYELVRIRLFGGGQRILQIMIDRTDGHEIGVEDCKSASRRVAALLDVEDPIRGAYLLEVSSPGIDRPLTRAKDFERFAGREVRLELTGPIGGRQRFRGRLAGLVGEDVVLSEPSGYVKLPFARIAMAKLVMTDDLLAPAAAPLGGTE